jgi:spore coat polysaccharide biosynthesis protein SpsF
VNTAIIQARMGSTRLPGKIMFEACGESLFSLMLKRIKNSKKLDQIIVATTTNRNDDVIVNFCKSNNIDYFRGSENDVLSRYFDTAKFFSSDVIIRLTSDTPLLDSATIDTVISQYENNEYDFVSNQFPFPRTYPDGYNVEVFSFDLLKKINQQAKKPSDREHVTTFITMQPKLFKLFRVDYAKDVSKYRFNLDYDVDYQLIKSVFEELYLKNPNFTLSDIIFCLKKNPFMLKLNAHVKPYQNILKSFEEDLKQNFKPYTKNYYFSRKNL